MTTMTPSYLLGLSFILAVSIIWSLASVLVQHLYHDLEFDSPFLLTYICTSLFVILLPIRLSYEYYHQYYADAVVDDDDVVVSKKKKLILIPWSSSGVAPILSSTQQQQQQVQEEENDMLMDSIIINEPDNNNNNDDKSPAWNNNNDESSNDDDDDDDDDTLYNNNNNNNNHNNFILGHYETMCISAKVAPLWFFANYFYNLSLNFTSISSSTIIASTGSLFTFVLSVVSHQERFTNKKLLGVLLCVGGSAITAMQDHRASSYNTTTTTTNDDDDDDDDDDHKHNLWGDFAGLLGALGYGVYTVLIRTECPKDERHISMQLLFGYIGLFNMVALSPIVLLIYSTNILTTTTTTTTTTLTATVLLWIILKGLLDNVLSDYLWARSILLTSATVATLGTGLTIPLAFLSDWWTQGMAPTWMGTSGALGVLVGFALVNIDTY